jgi:threonylcarbamoyladenosine tRNA methylthiotransferase MtaB
MTEPLVVTFGCRLNALESQVLRERTAGGGTQPIVVNTCAVTSEAVRQARQAIRRLRRAHPGRTIVVTGCAAQLDPRGFAAMPEVDRVVGNEDKLAPGGVAADGPPVQVSDFIDAGGADTAGPLVQGLQGRTRAFAQIQRGCDHRCTFCIVPFARGPNRSIEADTVVEQVRVLCARGFREVVLTGVDICSWGSEQGGDGRGLGWLVRRVLHANPTLPRLRLSTLDPAAVDPELFTVLAEEPRLMPHWHLSLQAADDMVLKRMKRRHDRACVRALVDRARSARPDIAFGADLIAGFPTETEAMFANTLSAIEEFGLSFVHVFPYSPRPGTPAARMPQVPREVRHERARLLRAAGSFARDRHWRQRIGAWADVLIEDDGRGRDAHYAPVRVLGAALPGEIVRARVLGVDGEGLVAERVS